MNIGNLVIEQTFRAYVPLCHSLSMIRLWYIDYSEHLLQTRVPLKVMFVF